MIVGIQQASATYLSQCNYMFIIRFTGSMALNLQSDLIDFGVIYLSDPSTLD